MSSSDGFGSCMSRKAVTTSTPVPDTPDQVVPDNWRYAMVLAPDTGAPTTMSDVPSKEISNFRTSPVTPDAVTTASVSSATALPLHRYALMSSLVSEYAMPTWSLAALEVNSTHSTVPVVLVVVMAAPPPHAPPVNTIFRSSSAVAVP